jgi:choice-of-anchor A domain-containing protein
LFTPGFSHIQLFYAASPLTVARWAMPIPQNQLHHLRAFMNRPVTATPLRRALRLSVLAAPVLVAASVPARAAVITANEILDQFNAVVTDNFSTNSDVEGRLVAGNINNSQSSTFYKSPNPLSSPSSFKGVNALTIQSCPSCNVNNGGGVNFITSNSGTFNLNAGGSVAQNNPAFTMSEFTTPLNALQTTLAGLTSNSTVSSPNSNSLVFDVTPVHGVSVFDISGSDLAGGPGDNYNITFMNATAATTIVIDVTGTFTEGGGENFNGDTFLNEHVIWNFEDATNVSVKQWHGAVLAGDATVTNNSPMEGFLYSKNFVGGGELHDFPFEGTLPSAVPEPSTWAMMALGFAGLGFLGFRSRKAATA